ncbi:MAG: hypothetical protein WCG27_01270 [Pseudomonadota bacterium]
MKVKKTLVDFFRDMKHGKRDENGGLPKPKHPGKPSSEDKSANNSENSSDDKELSLRSKTGREIFGDNSP